LSCPFFKKINQSFKTKMEETIMATNKSMMVLFGVLMISSFILGSSIQAGAETLKFKFYSYVTRNESVPVGDVEGHILSLTTKMAFCILENGEIATEIAVITNDSTKGFGSAIQYRTMTFADGSTIIVKAQTTAEGTAVGKPAAARTTREIIKGTGRFEGIKGTGTSTVKYLPVEKGEAGPKGIGEGTLTYTLPSK
jgi:hypothetical protein